MVEVQFTISGPGKLLPSEELYIYNGTDGRIYKSLVDNKTGIRGQFEVYSFERGDNFRFISEANLNSGKYIDHGDTLGTIISNVNKIDLLDIENSLNELKYIFDVAKTGEKSESLEIYEAEYKYAKVEYDEHSKLLVRYKALVEKGLVSEEDYEIEVAKNKLLSLNVIITESKINAAKTGSKSSEINLIKEQIVSASKKLEMLKKNMTRLTIISPIKGVIERNFSNDTLLTVSSNSDFVLLIPIKLAKSNFVTIGQKVTFLHPSSDTLIEASIIDINNKSDKINETDVILVFANSINNIENLHRDMIVDTKIYCSKVTLLNYILLNLS